MSLYTIRHKYKKELGEHIECVIFKYVYVKASNMGILLYWDGIFMNLYLAEISRVVKNIELRPELLDYFNNSSSFMELTDIEINDKWASYNKTVTLKEVKYSEDYSCRKCHKKMILINVVQKRSLDEGTSTFFKCDNCGCNWTEN